ncbi:hypothetical protein MANY_24200 [Mycolicibacterium anyangense]|uniref:N-acetyltransferase domain-containing protein n=1 Tax=Mycolicibacterium anyangense TaxID=1431246 RepID=A0A6N4W9P3_9MYCO|nr:hypothetical protein MANY_24200 [Mycolicibacterium anyangense]
MVRRLRSKRDHTGTDGWVHVRPWRNGDGSGIDRLLDAAIDPLWEKQFHALHGADGEGPSWRRCRVATDRTGAVIGAATVVVNPLHAGRMPCAIEVAPPWRRQGVGSLLLEQGAAMGCHPAAGKLH